jgi:uncharacterized protein (TIGR02118 family)
MINFTVKYPYKKGSHFDMDYYCNVHLAIAKRYFGDTCKGYVVLKGDHEINEGAEPQFACIAHLFFNSVKEFNAVMEPAESELRADVKKFTDIEPVTEFFEVSMWE